MNNNVAFRQEMPAGIEDHETGPLSIAAVHNGICVAGSDMTSNMW